MGTCDGRVGCCLITLCAKMAAIELYTPRELRWFQELLMSRGVNVQHLDLVVRICALYKNLYYYSTNDNLCIVKMQCTLCLVSRAC